MKKYRIYYRYNNGTTMDEEVEASSAYKALKKVNAYNHLKQVIFQTGSEGSAKAYEIFEDGTEEDFASAALYCRYSYSGKWYARYYLDCIK